MMIVPRLVAITTLALTLAGCSPSPAAPVLSAMPEPVQMGEEAGAPTAARGTDAPSRPAARSGGELVARVVDGDTVEMPGGEVLRVTGIDTPETKDPRKPVECGGPEATVYATSFLMGNSVDIARKGTDKYGRTLATLRTSAGDYGLAAVTGGYARVYAADTTAQLRAAEAGARAAKRGIWGACSVATTTTRSTTKATPTTTPRAAAAVPAPSGARSFANCGAARAAGVAPLRRGQAGYSTKLDRDGDGVACE